MDPDNPQRPIPQPRFILRGHAAPVHALQFFDHNRVIASGDSAGWVVLWSIVTKRALLAWKAHEGAILSLSAWTDDKLFTHGRDNRLLVWDIRCDQYDDAPAMLPIDQAVERGKQPWLLHSLPVNALNFCPFTWCALPRSQAFGEEGIVIAVPASKDSNAIDIWSLPGEKKIGAIPAIKEPQTGMVMQLLLQADKQGISLIAGFESGHVIVWRGLGNSSELGYEMIYQHHTHSQPILGLDIHPESMQFMTSSADAIIARHRLPGEEQDVNAQPITRNTKHAGQQGLKVRDDGKIFATAGWDKRVRVYSTKTLAELACLKWHRDGCYAVAFSRVANEAQEKLDEKSSLALVRGSEDAYVEQESQQAPDIVTNSQPGSMVAIRAQREQRERSKHWLAAGSKDGKVSLWDIF